MRKLSIIPLLTILFGSVAYYLKKKNMIPLNGRRYDNPLIKHLQEKGAFWLFISLPFVWMILSYIIGR